MASFDHGRYAALMLKKSMKFFFYLIFFSQRERDSMGCVDKQDLMKEDCRKACKSQEMNIGRDLG